MTALPRPWPSWAQVGVQLLLTPAAVEWRRAVWNRPLTTHGSALLIEASDNGDVAEGTLETHGTAVFLKLHLTDEPDRIEESARCSSICESLRIHHRSFGFSSDRPFFGMGMSDPLG